MKRLKKQETSVQNLLSDRKIATLDELKAAMGTSATMTVYRYLSRMGYLASYSHRGRFYTLPEIPLFDNPGLWSCCGAMFSRYGNLLETAAALVEQADAGFTASELELLLQVEPKHALLELLRRKRITRAKFGKRFVYLCAEAGQRRRQKLTRSEHEAHGELAAGLETELLPDELKAAIILFFSLLNERQRRVYAGLEATKLGHGGDRKIAEFLELDVHTVAKGRRELSSGTVERGCVRRAGGGRKRIEKKDRKS